MVNSNMGNSSIPKPLPLPPTSITKPRITKPLSKPLPTPPSRIPSAPTNAPPPLPAGVLKDFKNKQIEEMKNEVTKGIVETPKTAYTKSSKSLLNRAWEKSSNLKQNISSVSVNAVLASLIRKYTQPLPKTQPPLEQPRSKTLPRRIKTALGLPKRANTQPRSQGESHELKQAQAPESNSITEGGGDLKLSDLENKKKELVDTMSKLNGKDKTESELGNEAIKEVKNKIAEVENKIKFMAKVELLEKTKVEIPGSDSVESLKGSISDLKTKKKDLEKDLEDNISVLKAEKRDSEVEMSALKAKEQELGVEMLGWLDLKVEARADIKIRKVNNEIEGVVNRITEVKNKIAEVEKKMEVVRNENEKNIKDIDSGLNALGNEIKKYTITAILQR